MGWGEGIQKCIYLSMPTTDADSSVQHSGFQKDQEGHQKPLRKITLWNEMLLNLTQLKKVEFDTIFFMAQHPASQVSVTESELSLLVQTTQVNQTSIP